MTTTPVQPPMDDENEETKEVSNEFQYRQKPARSIIVILAIALIIILATVFGILKAVTADTEDPSKIKFPEHVSKSLAEDQAEKEQQTPAQTTVPYQNTDIPQNVPQTEMIDPSEPVATQEETQSESTLDLNSAPISEPEPKSTDENKVDEKKPEAGPQSMIIWDRLPQVPQKISKNNIGHKPQIAIVIDDMGLNHRNSQAVVALNAALTLAYLPYAEHLPQQAKTARSNGHELIVHMPMEPDNIKQNNPGPDALLTSNSSEENVRRLDKNLSKFTGYMGMNNHMGSRLTANATLIRPILQDLKQRGLWFLDSKTIGNSVAGKVAGELGVPYVERDVFLDNVASVAAISQQLRQVEVIAKKKGYAVAIGHPHDATIAALKQWLPSAQSKGYELVSLSTIIAERFPKASVPQYAQLNKSEKTAVHMIEPAAGKMSVPAFGLHATSLQPTSQLR